MRLSWRDGVATVIVAALMGMYLGLLASGGVGFIEGPRSMALVGLLSALVLCPLSGIKTFDVWAGGISAIGVVTLGFGVGALVAQSWGLLAIFMVSICIMWALATVHHALGATGSHSHGARAAHA